MASKYAANVRQITASASVLDPPVAAIYCTVSGTIDITNQDGTTVSALPVTAGSTLLISPSKVTAITSATIYGIYDK